MSWFTRLLHADNRKTLETLETTCRAVNSREDAVAALDDAQLKARTSELSTRLHAGENRTTVTIDAFAVAREAAKRTLGQRPYDVQIMGALALCSGNIAEMGTGEGKTLVAAVASYLDALDGLGVHIVTVNDYLAARDADWMGRVHRMLGLDVGVILNTMDAAERRQAYQADMTYGTNNEFGFDYLRDNMVLNPADRVQRGHAYAIVDEADSILIDEARTPLIISGIVTEDTGLQKQLAELAATLHDGTDYEIDRQRRTVGVLDGAIDAVEQQLGITNLYSGTHAPVVTALTNAIKAKELYERDRHYVLADGNITLIDQNTGRAMSGRRYNDGLHQALEAKERVTIKPETRTLASITLQNYFRMYDHLSGMTGTASGEAKELNAIYNLGVVTIPPNRPSRRDDQPDLVYRTRQAKLRAVVADVTVRHRNGQPVLIGTASISQSEEVSTALASAGIPHRVLNAKQHAQEAEIIAQAGARGAVTVATNMAGRGTDILLGGAGDHVPDSEREQIRALGGLYVVGTERHESRRIDDQLRGRAGRQGDPGETRFYLSLEDDLVKRFKADSVAIVMKRLRLSDDTPIDVKLATKSITSAQRQVESMHYDTRKNLVKYDDILNTQRNLVYQQRRLIVDSDDVSEHTTRFLHATIDACCRRTVTDRDLTDGTLQSATLIEQLTFVYPCNLNAEQLEACRNVNDLIDVAVTDADTQLAQRRARIGASYRRIEKLALLDTLDRNWREHLVNMTALRDGVGLQTMARRDPLVAYQQEGHRLYTTMLAAIREQAAALAFTMPVDAADPVETVDLASVTYTAPNEDGEAETTRAATSVANPRRTTTRPGEGPRATNRRGGRQSPKRRRSR